MRRVLSFILVVLILALAKFTFTYVVNEIVVANYNEKIYNDGLVKALYFLNITQRYIPYYNEGNIYYRQEKYSEAIENYKEAINKNPPKERICDIRINLSLAMVMNIDVENSTTIYDELEDAKVNLYNNNCATRFGDKGDSKEAEELEKEIQELQEQYKNSEEQQDPNNQEQQEQEQEEEEESEEEKRIEEELREIQKEANQTRQENNERYEQVGNYEYYRGKKW